MPEKTAIKQRNVKNIASCCPLDRINNSKFVKTELFSYEPHSY